MTIGEIMVIRENAGDLPVGALRPGDVDVVACGNCFCFFPADELVNVSDYAPLTRGGLACEDCAHVLSEAAHVGHETCDCSQCGRRRQVARAWGVRVPRRSRR